MFFHFLLEYNFSGSDRAVNQDQIGSFTGFYPLPRLLTGPFPRLAAKTGRPDSELVDDIVDLVIWSKVLHLGRRDQIQGAGWDLTLCRPIEGSEKFWQGSSTSTWLEGGFGVFYGLADVLSSP